MPDALPGLLPPPFGTSVLPPDVAMNEYLEAQLRNTLGLPDPLNKADMFRKAGQTTERLPSFSFFGPKMQPGGETHAELGPQFPRRWA